jgi:RNA polymerase sigma-70 factor (ECF subfamily)
MTDPLTAPGLDRSSPDDRRLIMALRDRDEAAFAELIARYNPGLVRLATSFVGSRTVAEDVAQDAWVGVLRGIDRFEGRSSLRTWIYRILVNTAKTRGVRESRSVPFTALSGSEERGPSVDPDRFLPADDPALPHRWASLPRSWEDVPEAALLGRETRQVIDTAIDGLPPAQRSVIQLRDIEGFSAREVSDLLELSDVNERVLLHRARSKVRQALEDYLSARADLQGAGRAGHRLPGRGPARCRPRPFRAAPARVRRLLGVPRADAHDDPADRAVDRGGPARGGADGAAACLPRLGLRLRLSA